jgi:hypothetical protein
MKSFGYVIKSDDGYVGVDNIGSYSSGYYYATDSPNNAVIFKFYYEAEEVMKYQVMSPNFGFKNPRVVELKYEE